MATWPASLPDPHIDNYQESRQDQVLRSQMDTGSPKTRRRFTASISNINLKWIMTGTQISTLETFFEYTISGGALSFDWIHPRKQSTVSAKFKKPYQLSFLGNNYYKVTATFEILP